jgi:hypothetical protein
VHERCGAGTQPELHLVAGGVAETAEAGGCNIIVPGWYGFPQPAGGLPCPSPRKWHRPSMITEDFWSHNASDLP